jgi:DNA-binding transcriptional MerR regulator
MGRGLRGDVNRLAGQSGLRVLKTPGLRKQPLTPESIPGSRLRGMMETRGSGGSHRSGDLARKAGVSVDTLRHYERRGLLATPRRLPNGYRLYPSEALDRVLLIQRALSVGFTLEELTKFLRSRAAGKPPCREVRSLAAKRLRDVEHQLEELARFRDVLRRLIENWDIRLAKTGEAAPAGLLESLAPGCEGRVGASYLAGLRFSRRLGKKEKK